MNRSCLVSKLKKQLQIHTSTTAVVTVDMNRGCLDPYVATMPVSQEVGRRVLQCACRLLRTARHLQIPVIHTLVVRRAIEIPSTPFRRAVLEVNESLIPGKHVDLRQHNLEGTVQTELMPQLYEEGDYLINNKKRMSAFYGTDLEILLRTLKRNTLAIIGINTNTCVLSTAFDAYNRDFKVVLISDAVGSAFGEDLHQFALENVRRCMGWVLTLGEFEEKIGTLRQEVAHGPD